MFQPVRFGRYLLIDRIAMGGMAEIFLAKLVGVEGFEKPVAIKRILPHWSNNNDFIRMLIDEAKILVRLNHPNIVQVYELGKEGENYYIAMEYIDGIDLRKLSQYLKERGESLPLKTALFIAAEIAKGLSYAHKRVDSENKNLEIVHRDISPQNILISGDGEVKITDFGIAKAATKTHETATGALKGKFAYMSPEQANQEKLNLRSDIFSVGILLFELTTGKRLFKGKTDIETLELVRKGDIKLPEEFLISAPPRLHKIILKALEKDPNNRYDDAGKFAADIGTVIAKIKEGVSNEDLSRLVKVIIKERPKELSIDSGRSTRVLAPGEAPLTKTMGTVVETRMLTSDSVIVARPSFPTVVAKIKKKILRQWITAGILVTALVLFVSIKWISERREMASLPIPPPMLGSEVFETLMAKEEPKTEDAVKSEPAAEAAEVAGILTNKIAIPPSEIIPGYGTLSVQVAPWGLIYVDDKKERMESPLKGLRLETGYHKVKVFYKPDNMWLTETALILKDRHTRCVADFKSAPRIFKCGSNG